MYGGYNPRASQGRAWGSRQWGGYTPQQQPPMPYAGAGAWQQPTQNRAQWSQQTPQRGYRAGGGIGGFRPRGEGMGAVAGEFQKLRNMGYEAGLGPSAMDYISRLDIGGRQNLMQQMGYTPNVEGDIKEWFLMRSLGMPGQGNNYMSNPWMQNMYNTGGY